MVGVTPDGSIQRKIKKRERKKTQKGNKTISIKAE